MAILKMQRTQTAGNQDKFTFSTWIKKSLVGEGGADNDQVLLNGWVNGTNVMWFGFKANDTLNFENSIGGSNVGTLQTNRVFRDPSAWLHIVLVYDSANSTADDRIQFWINGVKETSMYARSNPSSGQDCVLNGNTYKNNLFVYDYDSTDTKRFRGNLAQTALFDGQAYTATDFGSFDTTTGIWKPKGDGSLRALNFGTNGFLLTYENASYLGYDYKTSDRSSNNDFTTNGTGTLTKDNPSNNFVTLNTNQISTGTVQSNFYTSYGNTALTCTNNDAQRQVGFTQSPLGQKGYFEWKVANDNNWHVALQDVVAKQDKGNYSSLANGQFYQYNSSGSIDRSNAGGSSTVISGYTTSHANGDICGCAFDFTGTNRNVWFHRNGTWGNNGSGVGVPASGTYPALTATQLVTTKEFGWEASVNTGSGNSTIQFNFGNGFFGSTAVSTNSGSGYQDVDGKGKFNYAVPNNFRVYSTKGLNSSTYISFQPNDYFATKLYTGTGSSLANTGVGFQPDFTWIKSRSHTNYHTLTDSVRGVTKQIFSNTTDAEQTSSTNVSSFDSDGFTVVSANDTNGSGRTYAAWNWKAGTSTGLSFAAGDITPSAYSVNTTSGIGIYKYTGPGTVGGDTIAHNLGATPKLVMVKRLSASYNWAVQHGSVVNTKILNLNTSDGAATNDAFHNTYPTSTLITLGSSTYTNAAAGSSIYVCYAFAPVKGYSSFGTYTGNGNANGTFIYTGFSPAFVIQKNLADSENWHSYDNKRNTYNVRNKTLDPDQATAESTLSGIDFLSNGFKIRTTATWGNGNGASYIYMAFAEFPMVGSNGTAGVAR